MRDQTVTIPTGAGVDWKGIGYLFSIAGVLLLGAKAMPKPTDPWWHWPALVAGMIASIIGFALRYIAHLREKQQIRDAQAKAKGR